MIKFKNICIITILLIFNISIFFTDIFRSVTFLQLIVSISLFLYYLTFKVKLKINLIFFPWIIFSTIIFMNIIHSTDFNYIFSSIIFLLNAILLVSISNASYYELKIIKCFCIIHLVMSLLIYFFNSELIEIFLKFLLSNNYDQNYSWRVVSNMNCGITTQPGTNAMILTILFLISFSELFKKTKNKILSLVLMLLSFVMILTTGKRAPILIIAITIFTFIFLILKNHKILNYKFSSKHIFVPIFITIIAFFIFSKLDLFSVIKDKNDSLLEMGDISNGRFELWTLAMEKFYLKPIFGYGIKNIYSDIGLDVHNIYIQILAETGLVGFLVFMCAIFYTFYKSSKILNYVVKTNSSDKPLIIFAYLLQLYLLIYGFFGNTFIDYFPLLLFYTSIILLYSKHTRRII